MRVLVALTLIEIFTSNLAVLRFLPRPVSMLIWRMTLAESTSTLPPSTVSIVKGVVAASLVGSM